MYALPDRKPRLCLSTRPVFVQEPIGKKGFHTRRKRGPQSGDRRNQIEASILTRTLFTHPPTLWQARKPATPFSFLLPSSFVPLSSPSRPPAQCTCPHLPHTPAPHAPTPHTNGGHTPIKGGCHPSDSQHSRSSCSLLLPCVVAGEGCIDTELSEAAGGAH